MSFKKQRHATNARSSAAPPPPPPRPQEPALKCPRCDSSNTKFCYYNNYNLAQPRYFCKTCRRYWTKGGALRNVPIGGGCRKNKKFNYSLKLPSAVARQTSSSSHHPGGGLKFFQGLSTAMDFQLPAPITSPAVLPHSSGSVISSAPPCLSLDPLMGFTSGFQEMGSLNFDLLNSFNQDFHWQLQQQRLSMLFLGENNHKENNNSVPSITTFEPSFTQKRQPIFFQEIENPNKPDADSSPVGNSLKDAASNGVERFLENSYETVGTSSSSMANDQSTKNWSGIQPWIELTQYNNSLP